MLERNKHGILEYASQDLNDIFRRSGIEMPPGFNHEIAGLIRDLFDPKPDKLSRKPPADFGDKFQGGFNVVPTTNPTDVMTDTLVVFCSGNDKLLNRIVDMLFIAGRHNFRKVFFITNKWDETAISGANAARWGNLQELSNSGTRIVFILWSVGGLSRIFDL